jgi:hypothetical protein
MGKERNRTEPPAKNRTVGGLPGPVVNTNLNLHVLPIDYIVIRSQLECLIGAKDLSVEKQGM